MGLSTDDSGDDNDYRDAVANADDDLRAEWTAVIETFRADLADADDAWDYEDVYAAARTVLADVAAKHDATQVVLDRVEDSASGWAGGANNQSTDEITAGLTPPLREQLDAEIEEELEEQGGPGVRYTADHGVGIDEYVESRLERVLKLDNTDAKSSVRYAFEFDETTVEFDSTDYQNFDDFRAEVSAAASVKFADEIASRQAADEVVGDPFSGDERAEDQYRKKSNGPEERPWGLSWGEVISHLTSDEVVEYITDVEGPNTVALTVIETAIGNSRAAHEKQSVVDAGDGAIHYDDDNNEYWVPSAMVTKACDEAGTTPESLVHELDARNVSTDEIAGGRCVSSDGTVQPTTRFWRLKAEEVETSPKAIVPAIETSEHAFAQPDSEGGTTSFNGGGDE